MSDAWLRFEYAPGQPGGGPEHLQGTYPTLGAAVGADDPGAGHMIAILRVATVDDQPTSQIALTRMFDGTWTLGAPQATEPATCPSVLFNPDDPDGWAAQLAGANPAVIAYKLVATAENWHPNWHRGNDEERHKYGDDGERHMYVALHALHPNDADHPGGVKVLVAGAGSDGLQLKFDADQRDSAQLVFDAIVAGTTRDAMALAGFTAA